jgi:hypothetical protein
MMLSIMSKALSIIVMAELVAMMLVEQVTEPIDDMALRDVYQIHDLEGLLEQLNLALGMLELAALLVELVVVMLIEQVTKAMDDQALPEVYLGLDVLELLE